MSPMFFLFGICAFFGVLAFCLSVRDRRAWRRTHPHHFGGVRRKLWSGRGSGYRVFFAISGILGFALTVPQADAQQVVHAMGGTIIQVDAKAMTMTMTSDQGYTTTFHAMEQKKAGGMLDKQVVSLTTPAELLAKVGDHVVVLYVGGDAVLSAIGIENLGSGPTALHDGTVTGFDKHSRVVTLKDEAPQDALTLSEKTVVDTPDGVTTGSKYKPSKGDHVQVKSAKGAQAALFLAVAT